MNYELFDLINNALMPLIAKKDGNYNKINNTNTLTTKLSKLVAIDIVLEEMQCYYVNWSQDFVHITVSK